MRLFTATLATETNTFSPLPTSIENYRKSVFLRPGEHPADAPRMCTAPLFVGQKRVEQEGFELIEGSCFAGGPPARPTAPTTRPCTTRSWTNSRRRCRSTVCCSACTANDVGSQVVASTQVRRGY